MQSKQLLPLALIAALLATPLAAVAQDEGGEEESGIFSWNAALTSDYLFRGVSQTNEDPALQLGADLNFSNGLYVGVWGSNVDFDEQGSPDVEVDYYVGWNTDLSERWNLDLMLNRYTYLGEADDYGPLDYNEFITTLTLDETYGFVLGYSNDVFALDDDGWYYGVTGSWTIADRFGLDVGVGHSTFGDSTGIEDYTDWSIAVNRDFGPVNVSLGYHGTDGNGDDNFGDWADDRLVLTFSIGG
ncbi:TorF family putative porin [Arenimonas fontis]|uniref:Uncharacterized protein n=1 Tax=Arenimonas fontis TaxID=2608255 RepID=A0A5B2ZFH4_9GAMM|nr:TorF family putative porin [Arenimonas fontis]KAA2286293.1 hypothetical protein F0415_02005 [Arenimonas fontis]